MASIPPNVINSIKADALSFGFTDGSPDYFEFIKSSVADYRAEKAHERQLQIIQRQSNNNNNNSNGRNHGSDSFLKAVPKPNVFDPKNDQLDHFFVRYENYCSLVQLDDRAKAVGIQNLLPPELNLIVQSLSIEEQTDYNAMKKALLKSAAYTPEGYRKRYQEAVPLEQDTFARFLQRNLIFFKEWLESSDVKQEFEDVCEFLVVDQILHKLPPAFVAYVKDRNSTDLETVGEIGDKYMDIHHPHDSFFSIFQQHQSSIARKTNDKIRKVEDKYSKFPAVSTSSSRVSEQPNLNRSFSRTNTGSVSNDQRTNQVSKTGIQSYSNYPLTPNKYSSTPNRNPSTPSINHSSPLRQASPGSKYCSFHNSNTHNTTDCRASKNSQASPSVNNVEIETIEEEGEILEVEGLSEFTQVNEEADLVDSHEVYEDPSIGFISKTKKSILHRCDGFLNQQPVQILLDSGAEGVFVDKDLVKDDQFTGKSVRVNQAEGPSIIRPMCNIELDCPYFKGSYLAVALNKPTYRVFLGQIAGSKPFPGTVAALELEKLIKTAMPSPPDPIDTSNAGKLVELSSNVITRSAYKKSVTLEDKSLDLDKEPTDLLSNRSEFIEDQRNCPSLKSWHKLAEDKKEKFFGRDNKLVKYKYDQGLLYQETILKGQNTTRLCIPEKHKQQVLYLGHHNPLSGHRNASKTQERIQRYFVWPQCNDEIKHYVQSCSTCQFTQPGNVRKAPMGITKLSTEPFSQVSIDIVGPINPASYSGKRFILTYVDCATRYADAITLKNIDSETVAEALFEICSRVGFPTTLTSDNGSNFTSKTFQAFLQLLQVRHIKTSVYHAQSNGITERYNGTLKRCLRRLAMEDPRNWDRCIPAVLFAYRDSMHASTGYSPFELIYGHRVRGPLEFLRECWESDNIDQEDRDVHKYILEMRKRLQETCQLAHESLLKSQEKNKAIFDRRARRRVLRPGDQVLLLLPTDFKKLLLKWKGPFTVVKRFDADHYCLSVNGRERNYHINQLKLYHSPGNLHDDPSLKPKGDDLVETDPDDPSYVLHENFIEIPLDPSSEESEVSFVEHDQECHLHLGTALATEESETMEEDGKDVGIPTNSAETYRDCTINKDLSSSQRQDLEALLASYKNILTDVPGLTSTIEHKIELTTETPLRHSYPLPQALSLQLKADLDTWIKLGVVESSNSPYCSPLLAVRKSDGTHRFCLDSRLINKVTKFDAEPIADPQDIFSNLSRAQYLSKMDLSAGFWQVPLEKNSKQYTAFSTRYGHYQFKVMPFGLVNSPASFSRLMRIVTRDLTDVYAFMDDVLIASESWEKHLLTLEQVFVRLKQHGLHAKPSKCMFGFRSLQYLGHVIGEGSYKPVENKVQGIQELSLPKNKTQLRSFLGSVSYYQKFIPNFSDIATPLYDLLTKTKPKVLQWTEISKSSFLQLKKALLQEPILQLPDPNLPFTLQTDASDLGLGAVLLQPSYKDPRQLAPIMYASRRLKSAEKNYSAIEKEALSIYWAVKKFEVYLYGRVFELKTDHRPLLHLASADKLNPRLKRWGIYLNLFRYYASHISGKSNCLADLLSRSPDVSDLSI